MTSGMATQSVQFLYANILISDNSSESAVAVAFETHLPGLVLYPVFCRDNYPLDAAAGKDFYIYDIRSGTEDLSSAIELQDQLIHLLKSAGMELHKWSSNNPVLLQKVSTADREYNFDNPNSATLKTLGLQFNPQKDAFSFSVRKIDLKALFLHVADEGALAPPTPCKFHPLNDVFSLRHRCLGTDRATDIKMESSGSVFLEEAKVH
ncbi:hypothetical protein HNY73_021374 [Argiope bruennichi]|uniref:Uncharacterized protein n=1 Tax=Argiope bruennichi TaxID=94029 RepID=A0A8T0DZD9_ARGBR|nr:hypothetical protein HNY73_021374 [Argiope bruennichi]